MRTRPCRPAFRALGLAVATLAVGACGGPTHEKPPENASSAGAATDEASAEKAASPSTPPTAPRPACADPGCMKCGEGFCPVGFYCDESVKGGAACSWLPACATKTGCDCLSRLLPSCRCEADGAGARVRCD